MDSLHGASDSIVPDVLTKRSLPAPPSTSRTTLITTVSGSREELFEQRVPPKPKRGISEEEYASPKEVIISRNLFVEKNLIAEVNGECSAKFVNLGNCRISHFPGVVIL